jgi:carotenoid cleavage dioxygenase
MFPMIPLNCDMERLKKGGEHWQWNPDSPLYLGVLPRKGAKGTDVKVSDKYPNLTKSF